ncbi:MAG: DNA polymerase III subunit beta [Paramuribaculum sp.]|nr:DNA polymerase III subunit beta [Paramuribaculum sp.]MDE6487752.1 DNA polymerase III subunit beta [Paramuribaculum sp.]
MKFNVSSKTLYTFASSVSKIISSRNALQILNNFLFELEDDTLTVTASDMDNSLVGRLSVTDAEGSGSFCLDARRIVELLKEMPDQGITFEINDQNLEVLITYTNGHYNTVALSGIEYPEHRKAPESETISFEATPEQIIKGIENTLFAVSSEEIRPQMMGILWDVKPESVVFVATDTRKLVKYVDGTMRSGSECSFILPVKGAQVIKNVFAKEDAVKVTVTPVSAIFESATYTFDCRLIKGNFPDYNRVIPTSNPYTFTADRVSFLNAVRRVAVFGDGGGGLVKFNFDSNEVVLRASDNSLGTSGEEHVPCNYEGEPLRMGFGSQYLVEILSTFSSPDIMIRLADPSRPALFLPGETDPDTELLMILMPMNVGE